MAKPVAKIEEVRVPAPQPAADSASLISMLTQAARDPTVDVPKMRELFQMLKEMQADDKRTKFLAGLPKLQAALPAVERKGTGHNGKKYARFEDFIAKTMPVITDNAFSLTFRIDQTDTAIKITGVLGHEAGHQETTSLSLPADTTGNKNAVQAWGSSVSYGKRYVGMTLLGIATEDEDDDGKAAGGKERITAEQAEQLANLVKQTEAPTEIGKIILQQCKAEEFKDIEAARFEKIKKWLKDKFGVE
jgi:hypothetical protein